MTAGWVAAVAAVVGTMFPIIGATWWLSCKIKDLTTGVEANQKGIDAIEERITNLDERIRDNRQKTELNDRAIHDHLLQVSETENPIHIGEHLCPFCEPHDKRAS